mgnify:CR=1 FL=1
MKGIWNIAEIQEPDEAKNVFHDFATTRFIETPGHRCSKPDEVEILIVNYLPSKKNFSQH